MEPSEWTEARLLGLISDKATEGLELEFKACAALENTDAKKREISKDVSALANSAGGAIIYGMIEKNHVADDLDVGFDQAVTAKEWLEQVISSNVHPRIEGLRIYVVPLASRSGRVAYVVSVPQAVNRAPHQAADKRYHKRFNFEIQAMEDYEIRDVLRRARAPDLHLSWDLRTRMATPKVGESVTNPIRFAALLDNHSTEPAYFSTCRIYIDESLKVLDKSAFTSIGSAAIRGQSVVIYERFFRVPVDFPLIQEQTVNVGVFEVQFQHSMRHRGRFLLGYSLRAPGCARDAFFELLSQGEQLSILPL